MADTLDLAALSAAFPYCEATESHGLAVLRVPAPRYTPFCRQLKELGFGYLSGLTAVDWPKGRVAGEKPSIDLVGHAFRIPNHAEVQFVVSLRREAPAIDSVTSLWPTANWHEREVFDMYGITFKGHPDMRRILTPEGFEGYPLRKDYVRTASQRRAVPGGALEDSAVPAGASICCVADVREPQHIDAGIRAQPGSKRSGGEVTKVD